MRPHARPVRELRPTLGAIVIGLTVMGGAGCVVQPNTLNGREALGQSAFVPVLTFQTSVGAAILRRNSTTGTYDIRYVTAPYAPVPLPLNGNVQMVGQSVVGAEQVTVFRGSNPRCPNEYLIFSTTPAHYTVAPFGNCRSDYALFRSKDGNSLIATQIDVPDPEYWFYSNAAVHGPTLRSALNANPRKPAPAAVSPPSGYRGGRPLPPVQQPPLAPSETPHSTALLQHAGPDSLPTAVEVPNTPVQSIPAVVLDDPQPRHE